MRPSIAVDIIIEKDGKVVLIKRNKEPFRNCFALPGGFVEYGEKVEEAAIRESKEETNLDIKIKELLGVYSDPKRDPRGHVISIVFIATPINLDLKSSSDAINVRWFKMKEVPNNLAFDHKKILEDFLNK
ncbi:MAG TPA: NUDIX hydrolase [Candidatus Aenigmarchaeota archaeon]|nr:NUDIX hydrolase [Candidatus Aenigmarchaeota archaeon]